MTMFIDGLTAAGRRPTDDAKEIARDLDLSKDEATELYDYAAYHHHGNNSTIGIMDDQGNSYCVGCWWCEGLVWPPQSEAMQHLHDVQGWLARMWPDDASRAYRPEEAPDA